MKPNVLRDKLKCGNKSWNYLYVAVYGYRKAMHDYYNYESTSIIIKVIITNMFTF